jgi:hypothetical protein
MMIFTSRVLFSEVSSITVPIKHLMNHMIQSYETDYVGSRETLHTQILSVSQTALL